MKFLIVATFKSNKNGGEVKSWIQAIAPLAAKSTAEIIVAPSFPFLSLAASQAIKLAAQDVSPFPPGSYTGAVNSSQLKDLSVTYCLVGHSERRRYFHETPIEIANKVRELLTVGITPILCLAEEDIFSTLAALTNEQKAKVIYCYEPPSAIGGSETASVEEISRVVGLIKESVGDSPIMYGGSVNANNLDSLLGIPLNGVLVSSASLDPASFSQIINNYESFSKE